MDEGVDPRQAPPGTLTLLQNGVFVRAGEVQKRFGMAPLSALDITGNTLVLARVFTRGDSLCAIGTDQKAYSYIEALDRWVTRTIDDATNAFEFDAEWSYPVSDIGSASNPDVARSGAYVAISWRSGDASGGAGGIRARIHELETGTIVLPPTQLSASGQYARAIACGAYLVVAWRDSATNNLYASTFNTASPSAGFSAPVLLGATTAVQVPYDVTLDTVNSRLRWAWATAAGIDLLETTGALAVVWGPNAYAAAPGAAQDVHASSFPGGDNMQIVYYAAGNGRAGAWDFTNRVAVSDFPIAALTQFYAICAETDTRAYIVQGNYAIRWNTLAGALMGNYVIFDGGAPITRPFLSATMKRVYMAAHCQRRAAGGTGLVGQFDTVAILELTLPNTSGATRPCVIAGHLAPRGGCDHDLSASNVVSDGAGGWLMVTAASSDQFFAGVVTMKATVQLTRLRPAAGRTIAILGGIVLGAASAPWTYDGDTVQGVGFLGTLPTGASVAGGTLTVGGTYLIGVVYERTDAVGVLHRSEPYIVSYTLTAVNQSVSIGMYHVTVTGKKRASLALDTSSTTWLAPYASDAAGSILYRVSQEPSFRSTPNDAAAIAAAAVTHTGTFPYGSRKPLYTTGGVLGDQAPPAFLDVCVHKDRVWGLSGDGFTVYFSKRMSDDPMIMPGFNDALTVRAERRLVALASHESVLLLLGEDALYYLDGEGPPATGSPTDFGAPRRIPASVGCLTPLSVVETPGGTFFQGTDGKLWLLREMSLAPAGKSVEDDIVAYPSVRSATFVENKNQVRFVCRNTADTAGIVLVYDLLFRQWSRFTYTSAPPRHGCYWKGKYVLILDVAGGQQAHMESSTSYVDRTSVWVPFVAETAWISSGGPMGWQRVRRLTVLGEYRSAHALKVEMTVDYASSYLQTVTFTEAQTVTNKDRIMVHLGAQNGMSTRSRALRVRLSDEAPAVFGTGEALRWNGLALEVVQQEGPARHGADGAKA